MIYEILIFDMKRYRYLIGILALFLSLPMRGEVSFRFAAGTIAAGALKTRMEKNISMLLTEIQRAGSDNKPLNLAGLSIEPEAKNRLNNLWNESSHFVCDKPNNISKCLNDYQGYQVRAIPITMKPNSDTYEKSLKRELTISLSKSGVITGVRPALELEEDVSKILYSSGGVKDIRQRMEILKWVEDFRCYYNEKNIKALDQIYSDDALIITGSVVKQRKKTLDNAVKFDEKIIYSQQSKYDYMKKLRGIFTPSNRINVQFDHISVVKHGAKPNIYGVTLHQKWGTTKYTDEGWLFLLWDFNDPENPQILVRTWQTDNVIAKDKKIININDFDIY